MFARLRTKIVSILAVYETHFSFFFVVAWRKIPGRSEYIQDRRKVYKSVGPRNNVMGIMYLLIEIELTYLPELGG